MMLQVRDLCVSFGARRVVDRVSFTLDAGEKLALVGESGSGKTVTALSTLRLLDAARLEGEILFQGRDVLAMGPGQLQALRGNEIAVIFQEPMTALNPVMTVGAQIMEALQQHKGLGRARPGPGPSRPWPGWRWPSRSGGWTATRTSSPAASASAP